MLSSRAAKHSPISENEETPTLHCDVTSWAGPASCGLASAWTWSLKAIKGQPQPSLSRAPARGPCSLHNPREAYAGRKPQVFAELGRACPADHNSGWIESPRVRTSMGDLTPNV